MITLNTSYSTQNYNQKYRPSFKGADIPRNSAFLAPFKRGFKKTTDGITKGYSAKIFSSKLAAWLARRDNIGSIVDHMQTLGSFVISGMYMTQTLRNKEMDDKRKKTLAINQGLTLVASTAIAYVFSNLFEKPWDKHIAIGYAQSNLPEHDVEKELKQHQIKTANNYMKKHRDEEDLKGYLDKLNSDPKFEKLKDNIDEYVKVHPEEKNLKILEGYSKFKKPNLVHFVENVIEKGLDDKPLTRRLNGLSALKSLIIFGSVYRFIGPVVVTPIASWIADKFIHNGGTPAQKANDKDIKQPAQQAQPQEVKTDAFVKPMMAKFLGDNK